MGKKKENTVTYEIVACSTCTDAIAVIADVAS